jgi:hypothetical protein
MNDNGTYYAASSNGTTVWEFLTGHDDAGSDIYTKYRQEITTGPLEAIQQLYEFYAHGFLSPSSELGVYIDIYDRNGVKITSKISGTWTPEEGASLIDGYGSSAWGTSSWGGDVDNVGLIESFTGGKCAIRNYQRMQLRIESHGKVEHAITYFKFLTRVKRAARRRNTTIS